MVKVLFVCLGNICRSPTAEGVFKKLVRRAGLSDEIKIDSAGTGAWHVNQPPDQRSHDAALKRGIDLSTQRARKISTEDFNSFDYLVAMDRSNVSNLKKTCPPDLVSRISLLLEYAPELERQEVPDPYQGGDEGFDLVLDLIEVASQGLLSHIINDDKS